MKDKKSMQAICYRNYGGPDVLIKAEVEIPEIDVDEVLIKVAATALNPIDVALRSGLLKEIIPLSFPFIPNCDVSGVVEKVGTSVSTLKKGDKVFASLDFMRNGGAAEYVVSKANVIALAPKNISLQDLASIPSGALTAWQGLFNHGQIKSGHRVLITAAAGGVGSLAVQLAKWKNAYVVGTASEASFTSLKELGIDEIIDYKNEKVEERITEKFDVIFNLSPLNTDEVNNLLYLLKEGGTLVSASNPADQNTAKKLNVKAIRMAVQRDSRQLSQIAELVDSGDIKPYITERLTLDNIKYAHENVGNTRGKVLILVNENL